MSKPVLTTLTERGDVNAGLSTGSLNLNLALSGNPFVGLAWGRIVEIYGPEMSGKTTLTNHLIHEAQRLEDSTETAIPAMFIDAEHAFDPDYAESIGIDLSRMAYTQPDSGEEALHLVEEGVDAGYKIIIIDSVAALTPLAEIEGEMGEAHIGLHARLMSQALRKLAGKISKAQAIVVFINQLRVKIGTLYGNPETTTGGRALKFYASYRIEIRTPRSGKKEGKSLLNISNSTKNEIGIDAHVKVVKNKLYPPYRTAIIQVDYGKGINKVEDLLNFLHFIGAFGSSEGALYIPCKGKRYTRKGLRRIIQDIAVQQDVWNLIESMNIGRQS